MRVSSAIVIAIFAILFLSCSEDKEDVIKEVAYYSDGTDNGYDYVLYADSDMVFDKPDIERLLAHNVDICSGLYVTRVSGRLRRM